MVIIICNINLHIMTSDLTYLEENLSRAGMSSREASLYLALLQKGESSIVTLSSHTDLNRPAVYDLVAKMLARGFISKTKKGKREFYVANHPEVLRPNVECANSGLMKLVDNLSTFAKEHNTSTNISTLYGKEGIRSVFKDLVTTLKKGEIFYRYSGPKSLENAESYLPHDYRKIRDEKQLERYVITRGDIADAKKKRLERDIKILPGKSLMEDMTKLIYANRVAYINYEQEQATVIYDQTTADFEKETFMNLWKVL
jgi:sugar-specific transcriptional regulator TrmB